jgi:hypothetical protein
VVSIIKRGKGVMNSSLSCRRFLTRGILFLVSCMSVVGCAPLNDPNNPYGYGGPYGAPPPPPPYYGGPAYGGGYYGNDPYYTREQRQLERERQRLEDERRRLEREREYSSRPPPPPPRPAPERCPPGFSPSERKCTPEERRRGCRDMRLPGGLGCVDRR